PSCRLERGHRTSDRYDDRASDGENVQNLDEGRAFMELSDRSVPEIVSGGRLRLAAEAIGPARDKLRTRQRGRSVFEVLQFFQGLAEIPPATPLAGRFRG